MRRAFLLLVVIACLGITGCAVNQQINQVYVPSGVGDIEKAAFFSVSVLVTDDRPYVLSGEKEACYIGKYRAGFGNPWDVRTKDKRPLAEEIKRDLAADLHSIGLPVVDSNAERLISISIQDYNFDCYINCRVWHSLYVQVKDGSGNVLHSKNIVVNRSVTGSVMWGPKAAMEKDLPLIYAKMIQDIVRDDQKAIAALKRESS
jgi:hypothetical protein